MKKLQPPRSSHVLVRLGNLYRLCRSEAGLPRSQRRSPGTEKESPGRPFGRRCGVFYNFHTGANVGLAVVEPCDPPLVGKPRSKPIHLAGASSKAAKILSCLSIPVSAVSMRLIAYVWRKRQLALKQERYGPTSLERG